VRKALVFIVLLCIGAKYGIDYLFSDGFQKYGDTTKKPWTCRANIVIGEFLTVMSHYKSAGQYFRKTVERCPDTPMAEAAAFEYAKALESQGLRRDAVDTYDRYFEKYPTTKRGKLAEKSAAMLRIS